MTVDTDSYTSHGHSCGFLEDDAIIRENYTEILRDEGSKVIAFSDQHEALKSFKPRLPDIVTLDVGLNGERDDGVKLCAELRTASFTRDKKTLNYSTQERARNKFDNRCRLFRSRTLLTIPVGKNSAVRNPQL